MLVFVCCVIINLDSKVLYIYIQKLINSNKIDFYDYLVQLKQKLQIENIICIDEGNPSKFEQFEFILDDI